MLACGTGVGGKLSCQFPFVFGRLSALVLPSKEQMTLAESVSVTGGEA